MKKYLVLLMLLCSITFAQETVVDESFTTSPWTNKTSTSAQKPQYGLQLRDYGLRRNFERQGTKYDLINDQVIFSWPGKGLWRFVSKSVPAYQYPTMELTFTLVSGTITWYDNMYPKKFVTPGTYVLKSDFSGVTPLGKYDTIPSITLQVDSGSGSIIMNHYTLKIASNQILENKKITESYDEPSILWNSTEALDLYTCENEPITFSILFNQSLPQVTFDPANIKWTRESDFRLVNDPSLLAGGGNIDSLTSVPVDVIPGDKAWITSIVSTGKLYWQTNIETIQTDSINILSSGILINTITVNKHIYKWPVMQEEPAVGAGIYVVGARYEVDMWDSVHKWMHDAGITISTNPIPVPMKYVDGKDQEGKVYQQKDLYDNVMNRRKTGLLENPILSTGIMSYEIWRLFNGSTTEKRNVDGSWIGPSAKGKAIFSNNQFSPSQFYAYSMDEAQGKDLDDLLPLWKQTDNTGIKWFAAIHNTEVIRNAAARNYINFFIMTERNWIFNQQLREEGKLSGKYGYPFTDTHGYAIHRMEFFKCLQSEDDYYINYALNDINGNLFDNNRKMCLIIPTANGIVETTSGLGFKAGVVDMKYVAFLKKMGLYKDYMTRSEMIATLLETCN